jgi:hypothetical protein
VRLLNSELHIFRLYTPSFINWVSCVTNPLTLSESKNLHNVIEKCPYHPMNIEIYIIQKVPERELKKQRQITNKKGGE